MIPEAFKRAVRKRDIRGIKSAFFVFLSKDKPNSHEIAEVIDYILKNGIARDELFVPHDGESFPARPSQWDKAHYRTQVGKIENNFSRERLEHIGKLADTLFPAKRHTESSSDETEESPDHTPLYVVAGIALAALLALIFA